MVRFAVPEPLTSASPPSQAELDRFGTVTVRRAELGNLPARSLVQRTFGGERKPLFTSPFTDAELGQPTSLTSDDVFSEAQGSAELERQILGMLAEEDVEESAVRVQVRTITSPDQLRAWLSRDPKGSLQFTAYQPGASADKRIRVRIQAKFYNATPGAKVPMRRLDILEANTKVEAYSSRGRARGLDAEVSLGLEYPQAPGGYETQGRPSYNRRFDLGTANTTMSVADQMVSGRWLTHPVEDFTEHRTDIVYQITTEVVEQNSVRSPHPTIRSTFVKVDRGLAYLRPEPLRPGDPPPGVPASLRPDLIPALSTTERLDCVARRAV